MRVLFTPEGWADYLFWQEQDRATLRRINELIRDVQRDPFRGTGKPEPLRGGFTAGGRGALPGITAWCIASAALATNSGWRSSHAAITIPARADR